MSRFIRSMIVACLTIAATLVSSAAFAQICPTGSRNANFEMARDLPNCKVTTGEGNPVGARYGRVYNVYCPARMTKDQAQAVGKQLAVNNPVNKIPTEYKALDLKPTIIYVDTRAIKHLYHYNCPNTQNMVATHLKIEYSAVHPTPATIAKHAYKVNESGSYLVSGSMDREYKLKIHHMAGEKHGSYAAPTAPRVRETAKVLMMSDPDIRYNLLHPSGAAGYPQTYSRKLCLLESTDIQCAPCTSSDKLVVRVKGASSTCPSGTYYEYVPTPFPIDLAAARVDFRVVTKATATSGTIEVIGTIKNEGSQLFSSTGSAVVAQLLQGNTVIASVPLTSLPSNGTTTVKKQINWNTANPAVIFTVKIAIGPDTFTDSNTSNDDGYLKNNSKSRSSTDIRF